MTIKPQVSCLYKAYSSDTVKPIAVSTATFVATCIDPIMKLRIAPAVSQEVPRLLLGIVTVKNANNSRNNSVIPSLIRGAIASKQRELQKLVAEGRDSVQLWKVIDKNPHILQLLDAVRENDYLSFGNSLEDLALLYSIRNEIPIACFDLDEVCGDIELTKATGAEPFRPRSSIKLEHAAPNEVIYRDRAGAITRQWAKHLSQRTGLTTDTRNAAWIIETIGDISLEKMKNMLKEMERTIKSYCGGTVEMAIIGETITEIDLGVTGKTGLNDADYKPDPRRLAFHQKLIENFEKMRQASLSGKEGGGSMSLSAKGEKKELPPAELGVELPAAEEEKELPAPVEEKMLPAPDVEEEKELSAPPEEKMLPPPPTKTEASLIEMLTSKFTRKSEIQKSAHHGPNLSCLLNEQLRKAVKNAISKAFPDAPEAQNFEPFVEQAKDPAHGDYATNAAMALSKILKQSPQDIAKKILDNLDKPACFAKAEFAPPGFINVTIDNAWVAEELPKIIGKKAPYLKPEIGNKETVLVEYSSPNIAKPLGIHHLLSTIIGQAIYNIYDFLGYKTVAINHIGDWGTQFGKLTVAYKLWGDKKKVEKDPIEELLKLYVQFHDIAEKDPGEGEKLEQQARDEFKKLEDGDKENLKLWQWFVAMSLKDAQKTYDALGGIYFDKIQGESFYNDKMDDVLEEGKVKHVFEVGEEGALVVKFENDKYPPFLVLKSDGATLYGTRDLAAVKYRLSNWNPQKIIYVVDMAQSLHFQQLFETAKKLQWISEENPDQLTHVSFGRMRFEDGSMSTRKGNIVRLNEVLREAVERAKKIVAQKSMDIPEKKHNDLARIIGIGAVKYNILSQNRATDIVFSWDKMLSLDGNSAPYLQYTCARANSILRKASTEKRTEKKKGGDKQSTLFDAIATSEQSDDGQSSLTSPALTACETQLSHQLVKFPEVVYRASMEYRPNIITNYLYETAKLFNTFYHEVPVLQAESESLRNYRLELTEATKTILKQGLELIGIEVPEEM